MAARRLVVRELVPFRFGLFIDSHQRDRLALPRGSSALERAWNRSAASVAACRLSCSTARLLQKSPLRIAISRIWTDIRLSPAFGDSRSLLGLSVGGRTRLRMGVFWYRMHIKCHQHLSALRLSLHTPLNPSTCPFLHARSAFVLSLPLSHTTSRHSMALVALIYVSSGSLGTDFCISPITPPLLQKLVKEDKPSSPSQYADSKWVNGEQAQAGGAHPGPAAKHNFQELQRDAQGEEASLGPVRELRR